MGMTMVLKTLILLNILTSSSATCPEGQDNCTADYDGEELGFAQIKAHTAKKRSGLCPRKIAIDWCDSHGHPNQGENEVSEVGVADNEWGKSLTKCEENPHCYGWTLKYEKLSSESNCYLKDNCDWPSEATDDGNGGPNGQMFNGISGFLDYHAWGVTGACEIQFADSGENGEETELTDRLPPSTKDWEHCAIACRNAGSSVCLPWTFKYSELRCWGKSQGLPEYYKCSKDVISGAPAAPGYEGKSLAAAP